MKRIILICSLLINGLVGFSQSVVNRSNGLNTLNDPRWESTGNLIVPRYFDTTAANANIGIDSSGAIFYSYLDQSLMIRKHNPKRWVAVGSGAGNPNTNIGVGYRLAVLFTNDVKTLYPGIDVLMDSTTNSNSITIHADTTIGTTKLATQGYVSRALSSNPLTSAHIFVGNGSNIATDVNPTLSANMGVFGLSNTGVFTYPFLRNGLDVFPSGIAKFGSSNNRSLNFYSNNTFRAIIDSNGLFGYGVNAPQAFFHVSSNNASIPILEFDSASLARFIVYTRGQIGAGDLYSNLFFGFNSGMYCTPGASPVGRWNNSHGMNSLRLLTTGNDNNAFGEGTGEHITTAYHTISIGTNSNNSLTTGNDEISIGVDARSSGVTTAFNVAIGDYSQWLNLGNGNSTVGHFTIYGSGNGSYNSGVGLSSLQGTTNATESAAVGWASLYTQTTGGAGLGLNSALGSHSGFTTNHSRGLFLGAYGGYYSDEDDAFYVHNSISGISNETDGKNYSMLYGKFGTGGNNMLRMNGKYGINKIPDSTLDILGGAKISGGFQLTNIPTGTGTKQVYVDNSGNFFAAPNSNSRRTLTSSDWITINHSDGYSSSYLYLTNNANIDIRNLTNGLSEYLYVKNSGTYSLTYGTQSISLSSNGWTTVKFYNLNDTLLFDASPTTMGVTLTEGFFTFPITNGGTITESPAHTFTGAGGAIMVSGQSLPANVNGSAETEIQGSAAEAYPLGLDNNNTANTFTGNWLYYCFVYGGNYWYGSSVGSDTNTGTAYAAGDLMRVRRTGTNVYIEKSSDSGSTWTVLHTFSSASTAQLYTKIAYSVTTGGAVAKNPKYHGAWQ